MNVNETVRFNYTGGMQSWIVPEDGLYRLDVAGGSGQNSTEAGAYNGIGGAGGASYGHIFLTKGTKLYICCGGGAGNTYNGGGTRSEGGAGGGATHIALVDGTLAAIGHDAFIESGLIVAGGGGGGGYTFVAGSTYRHGGDGGGLTGGDGIGEVSGTGGTQTDGYLFGQGERGEFTASGGGGFYGGRAGSNYNGACGAGGGSGFIDNVPAITFKGITYQPMTAAGVNTGNGYATIMLAAKNFPTMYLGETPIEGMYLGTVEITDLMLGADPLA